MESQREENLPNTQRDNEEREPVTIRELLEAGVHFGHKRRRWNPKMRDYIFTEREDIHIIDLRKTLEQLKIAYRKVREVASQGGRILFVCTKKQGKDAIEEEARRAGVSYVSERWLGGTLTNFETIRSRVEHFMDLERRRDEGQLDLLPKKERAKLEKKLEKMERLLGGIREMDTLPDLIFIIDVAHEDIAVKEARKMGIFTVGLVDTNGDPDMVNIPIPGNDDAIRSIKLISKVIADAVVEGKQGKEFYKKEENLEEEKEVA